MVDEKKDKVVKIEPVIDLATARKAIEIAGQDRMTACMEELSEVLAKHGCAYAPSTILVPGSPPIFQTGLRLLEKKEETGG